jgi:hypothetical protein
MMMMMMIIDMITYALTVMVLDLNWPRLRVIVVLMGNVHDARDDMCLDLVHVHGQG